MPTDKIWEDIAALFQQGEINLNLGCGDAKITGLINCDLYVEGVDKKLDARDLWEYEDSTVNAIYANNLFEHFDRDDAIKTLREWGRVLKPGGYLILSLPDMQGVISIVYEWSTAEWEQKPPKLWDSMMTMIFGWQNGSGQIHKWGYSSEYLVNVLEQNGFKTKQVYTRYPRRPTPNFTVVAEKIKSKEEGKDVRDIEENGVD